MLFAASGVPSLLTASSWGRLADRMGFMPLIVASLVLTGAWTCAVGVFGNHLARLFVLRTLAGLSLAGFIPLTFAWMGMRAPASARGRMAGLGSTAMMLGNVIGPPLGSWLAVHLSLAATFYVPGAGLVLVGSVLGIGYLFLGGR
jgi:MFS family permease